MSVRDVSHQSDISKMATEGDGSFKRKAATFRNYIEKGGKFEPEKGRYHLYVSYACPWATRTIIVRKLKGLEDFIRESRSMSVCTGAHAGGSMSAVHVVSPRMGEHGWPFANVDPFPAADVDPLFNAEHVKDLYLRADPHYEGRYVICFYNVTETKRVTLIYVASRYRFFGIRNTLLL
jgi:glutathionyl-hydroquinone reductase